jgi:holo-[acyl-carrier protein] synthase
MKKGIGVDIIKISRFREKKYADNRVFYQKIFSKKEIEYCLKHKDPYPHFAGKFAAKEAIIKATGKKISLNQIVINNKTNGLEIIIEGIKKPDILISISHEKEYAISMSTFSSNI